MTTTFLSRIAFAALLALAAGCAHRTPTPPPGPPPSGTLSKTLITASAKVLKIDQRTRKVTLEMPDGSQRTVTVGEEVRNLPQVKAGDTVNVGFFESIVYQVRKPGSATPGVVVAQDAVRAEPGSRPGAAGAQVTTLTATITAVDKKAGTVTLTGPDGEATVIKPQDPTILSRVAAGELVEITLTEAIAVSVEAPAKK